MVGNKQLMDIAKPSEIVSLLLNDDELANLDPSTSFTGADTKDKAAPRETRDLWVDDGDDFFGATAVNPESNIVAREDEIPAPAPTRPASKRGRKPGRGRGSHRRKHGPAIQGDS